MWRGALAHARVRGLRAIPCAQAVWEADCTGKGAKTARPASCPCCVGPLPPHHSAWPCRRPGPLPQAAIPGLTAGSGAAGVLVARRKSRQLPGKGSKHTHANSHTRRESATPPSVPSAPACTICWMISSHRGQPSMSGRCSRPTGRRFTLHLSCSSRTGWPVCKQTGPQEDAHVSTHVPM